MRVLGFTAVEVLPALLKTFGYNDDPDQTGKTQTVRPAWKWKRIPAGFCMTAEKDKPLYINGEMVLDIRKGFYAVERPPYYKLDETVQVMWKQRSSPVDSWFCRSCGGIVDRQEAVCTSCHRDLLAERYFPKILGLAKINAVFKVSMHLQPYEDRGSMALVLNGVGHELSFMERHKEIPERDGFRSLSFMFEYFDKAYGLSTPKPFWVYRFERTIMGAPLTMKLVKKAIEIEEQDKLNRRGMT